VDTTTTAGDANSAESGPRVARRAVRHRRPPKVGRPASPVTAGGADEPEDYFKSHYGLAVSIARRYALRASWGESIDDLSQVALLGLVRAIDRFDPARGVPFSAFASATIAGDLKHHLRDRTWTVRPPRRVQDLYLRSRRVAGELTQEMGRTPTLTELGERLGASSGDVVEALEAGGMRHPTSIDSPSAAGEDRPLSARLPADDRAMTAVEERLALRGLMARLPERERRMVRLRFIDGLTQTEIAQIMSLSQAHVQRLLVRSLDQMRALAKAS
jgi:RNA polymerase sigma-B factor